MIDLHPNCRLINQILESAGVPGRVRMLPEAAPTAVSAAKQIRCDVGAIANSLIFVTADDVPLLILTSGAHRVDTGKVAARIGTASLYRATAEIVEKATGQIIGGVAPVGHPAPLRTLLDIDLAQHPEIWAAGGIAHAVFPISFEDLHKITGAELITVV